jgi:hypothetical protein
VEIKPRKAVELSEGRNLGQEDENGEQKEQASNH